MGEIHGEFDEVVIDYYFVSGIISLTCSIVGIVLLPLWIFGLGKWLAEESLKRRSCILTNKMLKVKHGIFFHTEKNIPLEKITDITILQGPLLRYFGLYQLKIETAGQSTPGQAGEGVLTGLFGAKAFRNKVLEYRDQLSNNQKVTENTADLSQLELLKEIAESLKVIEKRLS